MKNVRLDHELEARCSEFCKAMENRVVKLEKEIKDKASVSQLTKLESDIKGKADKSMVADLEKAVSEKTNVNQVEDLISTAMAGANASEAQGASRSEIEESVNRKVVELRDSTMREKNLIIHGIEESIAEDAATRKAADTSVVKDLFGLVESDVTKISNVVRLGKRNKEEVKNKDSKPRPVKVALTEADEKHRIMKNLSRIRETPMDSPFRKMSVTHDMSKSEREMNRQKVLEAKAMNEQDKSGKIKYIVKGPPWERKIIKVKKKEQES